MKGMIVYKDGKSMVLEREKEYLYILKRMHVKGRVGRELFGFGDEKGRKRDMEGQWKTCKVVSFGSHHTQTDIVAASS